MKAKEELLEKAGETYGYINILMDRKVEQYKLGAAERSANAISGAITAVILGLLGTLASVFGLIAVAFYIAGATDYGNGFGIVALAILLLLLLLFLLRRVIIVNPVIRKVINLFFAEKTPSDK